MYGTNLGARQPSNVGARLSFTQRAPTSKKRRRVGGLDRWCLFSRQNSNGKEVKVKTAMSMEDGARRKRKESKKNLLSDFASLFP